LPGSHHVIQPRDEEYKDMKLSRHVIGLILFVSIILLVGLLFWPVILENVIAPISLTAWLLLRIFVLSVDQKYYWGAIIFTVLIFIFRLLPRDQIDVKSEDLPETNATIRSIEYWRSQFILAGVNVQDNESFKRELIRLLLSMYASKQRTSTSFVLYEALEKGELPLPEHIRTFLFPNKQKETKRSFKKIVQSIRAAPQKWMRDWTGQETAECYRMIDEVLSFMEKSMEIKDDD
jgi:hypothetical protein